MSQGISGGFTDPLAQTFYVAERYGVFVTKIGVYFEGVSAEYPVSLELRNAVNGVPNVAEIIPNSIVTKSAAQMVGQASADATTETTFEFDEPIYLYPDQQYAFCLVSAAKDEYTVWTSRVGDFKVGTTQERVTRNIEPGVMFKSQSGLNYTAEANSDIKFNIYRASFKTQTAVVQFTDANPPKQLLGADPLYTDAGDATIRVNQDNHGFLVNDRVNITGLVAGTEYNGILGSSIMGTRIVTGIDGNNYTFEADSSSDSAVDFGGSTILASQHHQFSTGQLQVHEFNPGSTRTKWIGDFATSQSLAGSETAYGTSTDVPLQNQVDVAFANPHVILSDSNETVHYSGAQSTTIKSAMIGIAGNNETSPLIDLQRAHFLTINNLIDRQDSAATTNFNVPLVFVPETDPANGSALAKHITKPVNLANSATGIKVLFAANRPNGAYFDLYYRTTLEGSDSDILDKSFIAETIDTEMPTDDDPTKFREYRYTIGGEFADQLAEFNQYQIKIVMNSTSSAIVPRITDLRTIALGA